MSQRRKFSKSQSRFLQAILLALVANAKTADAIEVGLPYSLRDRKELAGQKIVKTSAENPTLKVI